MNCEQFDIRWNELLDQRQLPDSDAALQAHLRECCDCRGISLAQEMAFDVIGKWTAPQPPAGLAEKVLAEVKRDRVSRKWATARIAAALATAAAVVIACFPLLSSFESRVPTANNTISGPRLVSPRATDEFPRPAVPAIGTLAQQAGERYQQLARDTRDWSTPLDLASGWQPTTSGGEPVELTSAAAEWMSNVTTGLQPVTESTSATLRSLLHVLPTETSSSVDEERAS